MKLFVGYSKAPEQPQSSARPICHSHTMTSTGREPATICIAACWSSPHYALRHGRRLYYHFFFFFLIFIASMSHSYKPTRLGTWHRRHSFDKHIYKSKQLCLLHNEAGSNTQHIFFIMRLAVTHSISSSH